MIYGDVVEAIHLLEAIIKRCKRTAESKKKNKRKGRSIPHLQ
jgi:hypothetical protein